MQIDKLKKHTMIAAAVSAAVALAACDAGDADRAAAPGQPPSQATGPGDTMTPSPATPSGDTTAGERAGATSGAAPGTAPQASAQNDDDPSLGERAESAVDDIRSAGGDAAITAKVKSALVAEDDVRSLAIDVDTSDGRVVLEGEVPSAEQSIRIENLAQAVEGVLFVENRLRVVDS
ncbi:MAG: BON domain-containing protein [Burkholderiaceae bacterium]